MAVEEHILAEEHLISQFLSDKETVAMWQTSNVGYYKFDKIHHCILSGVIYAFNNDVLLTRQTYKDFLAQHKVLTPEQRAAEVAIYNRCLMRGGNRNDIPMLLEKVQSANIRRKTAIALNEFKKDKEKLGDLGANRALIEKLTALESDAAESKVKILELHKAKDGFMERLYERRNNPHSRLICNIPEIDETMNVGFKVGHLTMFCADVGSFKTTMMVNVGLNLFHQSHQQANILYIPLEMPAEEILQKIVARETQIPFSLIEHSEKLSEEQIKMIAMEMDKWGNLQHRFHIMESAERTKVSQLRREVEKRISYFAPRMVIVDYADNLLADNIRARSDEQMNDTLEDLRKMGAALGFGVITAAQLGRDALKKLKEASEKNQRITSTDIRGGQVMSANSDTVYAQWRNPAQPNEELIFTCIKARHGKNIFSNNRDKTILKVRPDIGLIESPNRLGWNGSDNDPLLKGFNTPPPLSAMDNLPEDDEEGKPF